MRVAVLHNPPVQGRPDSEDVIRQIQFVSDTLAETGHDPVPVPFIGGADGVLSLAERLSSLNPSAVFNLVESLDDDPRKHPAAAAFLDVMNIPHTGSPYDVLVTTTNKLMTKAILRSSGIRTPKWHVFDESSEVPSVTLPCIVKPAWEDASVGIHDSSVFYDRGLFEKGLREIAELYGYLLIEEYIDGREFNISILEDENGKPEVMPPAEIIFRDWPDNKPRIVNYDAKWDDKTFEYHNTVRSFPPSEDPLISSVADIARQCWDLFGLRGYARVDMRVDEQGRVHVIEINANPCISPDAGFMAATSHASLSPGTVIARILNAALRFSRLNVNQ